MLRRFFHWISIAFSDEKALYLDLRRMFGEYPQNLSLYKTAFIHCSASKMVDGRAVNNERLEYLGDAVLNTIVADYLYTNFPFYKEGQLTQIRSKVVNHHTLTQIARDLNIEKYLVSQAHVQCSGKYFYGDTVEALIGALFIDKGFKKTKIIVIDRMLKPYLDPENLLNTETDFKSRVIEWCQKNKHSITFNCKNVSPNQFYAEICIDNQLVGKGKGWSKKEAEQTAARMVWEISIKSY